MSLISLRRTRSDLAENSKKLHLVNFSETTLGSGAIRALAGCRRLESLEIFNGATADSVLAETLQIPQLRIVRFMSVAMTDDIIAGLGQLSRLHFLHLIGCGRISDAAFIRLAEAPPPKLQTLYVSDAKLQIAGFRAIAQFPHLQEFSAQSEHVDDAVLHEFRRCAALAMVSFPGTNVTQAGTTELQQALAGCQIVMSKAEQAPLLNNSAYRETIRKLMARGFTVLVTTNTGGVAWMRGDDPFPNGEIVFGTWVNFDWNNVVMVQETDLQLMAELSDLQIVSLFNLPQGWAPRAYCR